MIENIADNGTILAIIIRSEYNSAGVNFFTPDNFSQQVAFMKHPKNKIIAPHMHNEVRRDVYYTNEVLFIKKGVLRVDFYSDDQHYLESRFVRSGDTILLAAGGHGFEVVEDVEMIEVKQGPYAGEGDKTRFSGISAQEIRLVTDHD